MSKPSRLGVTGFLMLALGTGLAIPARAELSANDLNAELLKTRDEVKAPLDAWQAAITKKTKDEFDAVKSKLAATWKEGRTDAVKSAAAKLAARRQAITDLLAGDPERLDRVAKALKEQFDGRKKAIEEAGAKFDADAAAFQAPAGSDAKDKALQKLDELAKAALAPVSDAEWGKVFESAKVAFAVPTADEKVKAAQEVADQKVKEAATSVQKFVDAVERDFARIVQCSYTAATGTLVCDRALAVSAAEISTIEVSGLPHDKQVTVAARVAKDAPTEIQDGQIDPESDLIVLQPGEADKVSIDVHLRRLFDPTYEDAYRNVEDVYGSPRNGSEQVRAKPEGQGDEVQEALPPENSADDRVKAAWALRQADSPEGAATGGSSTRHQLHAPRHLVLIVSGRAPQITVQVKVDDGKAPGQLVTSNLELGYARWGVDSGGFFAIAKLSDEELLTEPGSTADKVKIKRTRGGSDYSQDTGIFLNLVPRNYPIFGIGIGFSANKDQPNTFYLGPSVRLLSFRNRAVASFSLGATMRSVKRFPGLKEGMEVSANDSLVEGKNQFKFAPYAIIQLGFSFGRIPGAKD